MGSTQSKIIARLGSTKNNELLEGLQMLDKACKTPSYYVDNKLFLAAFPLIAIILSLDNPRFDLQITVLRNLQFLNSKPEGITLDNLMATLGGATESILLRPILMTIFSTHAQVLPEAFRAVKDVISWRAFFGATDFAAMVLSYVQAGKDEVIRVSILPNLWHCGSQLLPIHKPLYVELLLMMLTRETAGNIRAQLIAEFSRILQEEATQLDYRVTIQLFGTLSEIISKCDPSTSIVEIEYAFDCLKKLVIQQRRLLRPTQQQSLLEPFSKLLSVQHVQPLYLETMTLILSKLMDAFDQNALPLILRVIVDIFRHLESQYAAHVDESSLIRCTSIVTGFCDAMMNWSLLPTFENWPPSLYRALSNICMMSLLSGQDTVITFGTHLLEVIGRSVGSYLQFFIGDLSLLFMIRTVLLLHPSRLKAHSMQKSVEIRQMCNSIEFELFHMETTAAERSNHRNIKDQLIPLLAFLIDYPTMIHQAHEADTEEGKFQAALWDTLNTLRAAMNPVMLYILRGYRRTQAEAIALLTIWYDRISFSGHFILLDVMNKAIMSILVKAESIQFHPPDPALHTIDLHSRSSSGPIPPSHSSSNQSHPSNSGAIGSSRKSQILFNLPASPTPQPMGSPADADKMRELHRQLEASEKELRSLAAEKDQLSAQLAAKSKELIDLDKQNSIFQDQIACPICYESFLKNKPACLECGHLFCLACIESVAAKSKKCPLCKAEINRVIPVVGSFTL